MRRSNSQKLSARSRILPLRAIQPSPASPTLICVPRLPPLLPYLLACIPGVLFAPIARGGADPDARVVRSVFFVAKSENRNQVHYAIRLDASCRPAGETAVFAYWRMLERGPLATEPLLAIEQPAYGLSSQRVFKRDDRGGSVQVTLNALPKRAIVIESKAVGTTCAANASAVVGGVQATLASVFVQLRWPFGVESLLLSGWDSGGHPVGERLGN